MTVQIIRGNALDLPLADSSVDLVVTSPPYFGLRSYQDGGEHYDGQIGAEATPAEFVDALIAATREMVRVLKSTGSIFVNLGDRYDGGSLSLIPERFRIACAERLGLTVRAVIVWHKPNGMPEPVSNRVARKHEDWVHLTLGPNCYCDIERIREAPADYVRKGGSASYTANGAASHGVGSKSLHQMNPNGALPGSVWSVPTEALVVPESLGVDHYAAFPMELPRRLIRAWSPPSGTVLDPFGGTGTTALLADVEGRHGISLDLSADYCRLAEWRTSDPKQRAKAARQPFTPSVEVPDGQAELFDVEATA